MNELELNIVEQMKSTCELLEQYHSYIQATSNSKNLKKQLHFAPRQFDILHYILNNDVNTVSTLSKNLHLSLPSLSITISKMCDQGFIDKIYDETLDSRNVILKPTDSAMKYYHELKNFFIGQFIQFYEILADAQKISFLTLLDNVYSNLKYCDFIKLQKEQPIEEISKIVFANSINLKIKFNIFFRDANSKYKDKISLTDKEMGLLTLLTKPNINTPSEISSLTYTNESTISLQLKKLIQKGYLKKEKSKTDSRKTNFLLTELGLKTLKDDTNIREIIFIELIENIDIDDKKCILESLTNLESILNIVNI